MVWWHGLPVGTKCSKGSRTEHSRETHQDKMRKAVVHKAVVDCLNHFSLVLIVFEISLLIYHYRWRNRWTDAANQEQWGWEHVCLNIKAMVWQQNFQSKWNYWNHAIYPLLFSLLWLVTFCHVCCEPECFCHLWGIQIFSLLFCSWKKSVF